MSVSVLSVIDLISLSGFLTSEVSVADIEIAASTSRPAEDIETSSQTAKPDSAVSQMQVSFSFVLWGRPDALNYSFIHMRLSLSVHDRPATQASRSKQAPSSTQFKWADTIATAYSQVGLPSLTVSFCVCARGLLMSGGSSSGSSDLESDEGD